jgi:hypothetical protein
MMTDAPTDQTPVTTKRTHYQIVLQAIIDLADVHRAASRQQIVSLTGLKLGAVDDTIKRLKEDGRVLSMVPGLFEPVPTTAPDRAISVTLMPQGMVKIEFADGPTIDATKHEARTLGKLLAGMAQETAQVESYRMLAEQVARMQARATRDFQQQSKRRRPA